MSAESLFDKRERLFRLLIHRRIPTKIVVHTLTPLVRLEIQDIICVDFDWLSGDVTVNLMKMSRSRKFDFRTDLTEIADVIVRAYEELTSS